MRQAAGQDMQLSALQGFGQVQTAATKMTGLNRQAWSDNYNPALFARLSLCLACNAAIGINILRIVCFVLDLWQAAQPVSTACAESACQLQVRVQLTITT